MNNHEDQTKQEGRKNQQPAPGINGPWPGKPGVIPVTDGRADDANIITRQYLDSIQIEERLIGAEKADLSTAIFNRRYASPIMTPAFSHLNHVGVTGRKPMVEYAQAARQLHILNWVGMETDETYAEIAAAGADTVRIIKPFADHDMILEQIDFAIQHGAVAVGVDIDHIFGTDGGYDVVDGQTMGPVTRQDLEQYVKAAGDVPFVAKGVLSLSDAKACLDAGVRGLVISHHHGRMPFAIPPLVALQSIREGFDGQGSENAVGRSSQDNGQDTAFHDEREVTNKKDQRIAINGSRKTTGSDDQNAPARNTLGLDHRVEIFVDCHIDSGVDAYKALALGAKAVSVGRGILPGLLKDGSDGVVRKINTMNQELAMMMGYTGVPDTAHFTKEVLWYGGERM